MVCIYLLVVSRVVSRDVCVESYGKLNVVRGKNSLKHPIPCKNYANARADRIVICGAFRMIFSLLFWGNIISLAISLFQTSVISCVMLLLLQKQFGHIVVGFCAVRMRQRYGIFII